MWLITASTITLTPAPWQASTIAWNWARLPLRDSMR
jgi:hypothetical protein